eukprot:GHRQ01025943.1.p2 GENE.GHRQ01025943.1~~GHRQ01025943.1.p2  ORF type:complete len:114 (-),score=38.68 GHRQ01025943.1:368-709(-)
MAFAVLASVNALRTAAVQTAATLRRDCCILAAPTHRAINVPSCLPLACCHREMLGTGSNGLGHSNPRQKIQYHLKLKQELEELRHEATVLLRERFHLQQCIRYAGGRGRRDIV